MIVIKNTEAVPDSVPNDGTGRVRVRCTVFTSNDDARIESVELDLSAIGGDAGHGMELDAADSLSETADGVYECGFGVGNLTDPYAYDLPIRATDSKEESGKSRVRLTVEYSRPSVTADPDLEAGLQRLIELGGNPVTEGNLVEVLADGELALKRRLELIRSAKKQINLQTYHLDDEGSSGRIMDALGDMASQGVEVNVILNSTIQYATSPLSALRLKFQGVVRELQNVGRRIEHELTERTAKSVGEYFDEFKQGLDKGMREINMVMFDANRLRKSLEQKGHKRKFAGWLRRYVEEDRSGKRAGREESRTPDWVPGFQGPGGLPALPMLDYTIHEKILVVDGERAIVGGRNLDDRYFTRWRDLDLYLDGPVVSQVQRGFLNNFAEYSAGDERIARPMELNPEPEATGSSRVQFVQSKPWLGRIDAMKTLVAMIQSAEKRIWASSQYLVLPDSLLRDALLDAVDRGVDVRILTNSYETGYEVAFAVGFLISLQYYGELLRRGVKIHTMNGTGDPEEPQPYFHTKQYLIDGKVACFGSFNLTMRSCYIESENLVNVFDRKIVAGQERAYEGLLRDKSTPVTPERLRELEERHKSKTEYVKYAELLY